MSSDEEGSSEGHRLVGPRSTSRRGAGAQRQRDVVDDAGDDPFRQQPSSVGGRTPRNPITTNRQPSAAVSIPAPGVSTRSGSGGGSGDEWEPMPQPAAPPVAIASEVATVEVDEDDAAHIEALMAAQQQRRAAHPSSHRSSAAVSIAAVNAAATTNQVHQALASAPVLFYRRYAMYLCGILLVLGIVCLAVVPIHSLLLVPSAALALYWLWNEERFWDGGDVTRCSNRDSSLMFVVVCASMDAVVSVFNIVVLCMILSSSTGTTGSEYHANHRHTTGVAPATSAATGVQGGASSPSPTDIDGSGGLRAFELIMNCALLVAVGMTVLVVRRLRYTIAMASS